MITRIFDIIWGISLFLIMYISSFNIFTKDILNTFKNIFNKELLYLFINSNEII